MSANPKFLSATAKVDEAAVQPFPNSRKVYVQGSRPDIRVPMREITLSDTPVCSARKKILQFMFTIPQVPTPILKPKSISVPGLEPIRSKWIEERNDTEELGLVRLPAYGRERLADPSLDELRFNLTRKPRRRQKKAPGSPRWLCQTQAHHT